MTILLYLLCTHKFIYILSCLRLFSYPIIQLKCCTIALMSFAYKKWPMTLSVKTGVSKQLCVLTILSASFHVHTIWIVEKNKFAFANHRRRLWMRSCELGFASSLHFEEFQFKGRTENKLVIRRARTNSFKRLSSSTIFFCFFNHLQPPSPVWNIMMETPSILLFVKTYYDICICYLLRNLQRWMGGLGNGNGKIKEKINLTTSLVINFMGQVIFNILPNIVEIIGWLVFVLHVTFDC